MNREGLCLPTLAAIAVANKNALGNMRSYSISYPWTPDYRNGRTIESMSESGRLTRYYYEPMVYVQTGGTYTFLPATTSTNCLRAIVVSGTAEHPNGLPMKSTFTATYTDLDFGNTLRSETRLLSGPDSPEDPSAHVLLDATAHLYDANHRRVKSIYSDGTWSSVERGVCGLVKSETARDGTVTQYKYDGMLRRIRTLTSSWLPLDGAPGLTPVTNVVEIAYDTAGRVKSRSTYPGDPDGNPLPGHTPLTRTWQWFPYDGSFDNPVEIEYDVGEEYNRRRTTYEHRGNNPFMRIVDNFTGGVSDTATYPDGSPRSQTEYTYIIDEGSPWDSWLVSSMTQRRSESFNSDGTKQELNEEGEYSMIPTYWQFYDFLGRSTQSAAPAFGNGWQASRQTYDGDGRLLRTETGTMSSPESSSFASTREVVEYTYDPLGNVIGTSITVDGNTSASETHTWYEHLTPAQWPSGLATHVGAAPAWWRCSASVRIIEDAAVTTSVTRVRMTGKSLDLLAQSASIDINGVVSLSTTSFNPASGVTTRTSTSSGSSGVHTTESVGGRTVSSSTPAGERADHFYDVLGHSIKTVRQSPSGKTTTSGSAYDLYGRIIRDIEICGSNSYSTVYTYSGIGNGVTGIVSPTGDYTGRWLYSNGRPWFTWGATQPMMYWFDPHGNMTHMSKLKNPNSPFGSFPPETEHTTQWSYDAATGLMTSKTYPDGSQIRYGYTPAGQLAARTNANGTVSRFFYSPGGKLQEEDLPAGTDDVLYGYDDQGNLTVAESAQCRYDTFYDYSKLRRDWEHVVLGNVTNAVFRRYDASGRDAGYIALVDIGGANGATQDVFKAYDALGRLGSISATVNGASPIAVTNFYDGSRHVGSSIHAGNCVVLREIVYAQNRDVVESVINSVVTNGVTNVVSRFDYAYDGAGRRTRRVDVASGIVTNSFGYDTRSQLVTAQLGAVQYGYNLTPYGNRTRSWGQALVNYTPDILNQYDAVDGVEPVYDLDGNLLRIPGRMTFAYDAKNQMTFCSNASWRVWNTYDHLGRRIVKETQYQNGSPSVRHYLYDGWNMIAESIHHSSFTNHNFYLWGLDLSGTEQGAGGIGGLLAVFRDGNWHVPLADANGNVTEYISGSSGTVVARYAYDAFGGTIAQSGPMAGAFAHRFSTKYLDTETGLYYYGRRFYDPIWGRWINRDPIEEDGGLNLYAFCGNDGINAVDFLGRKGVAVYKIHAIGDSMTYGVRTRTDPLMAPDDPKDPAHRKRLNENIHNKGWRVYLKQKLDSASAGKAFRFDFSGNYPASDDPGNIRHDGYPGDKAGHIYEKIQKGQIVCKEDDIYILLIGMNDALNLGADLAQGAKKVDINPAFSAMTAIARSIREDDPALFLWGKIPYITGLAMDWRKQYVPDKVNLPIKYLNRHVVNESSFCGATVFDLQNLFIDNPSFTDDGFHFSDAGNQHVASLLFEMIQSKINE